MKLLILDNFDSFTYNLAQLFQEQSADVDVLRNTASWKQVEAANAEGIVLSPGPGTVEKMKDFGICSQAIRQARVAILGVCLGHQGIAHAFGGKIRKDTPVHGKKSLVYHDGRGLFSGIKNPFEAARYHSLVVDEKSVPVCLKVTAWTQEHLIMGLQHESRPIYGVQFHPESFLTQEGKKIAKNFLKICKNEKQRF